MKAEPNPSRTRWHRHSAGVNCGSTSTRSPWLNTGQRPRAADLRIQMEHCVARMTQVALDKLYRLGLTPAALATVGCAIPPIGILPVSDLAVSGSLHEEVFVQPICSEGKIIDLVAWHPADPSQWWLRSNLGSILGEDCLFQQDCSGEIVLHGQPLDWLCAGGSGVCILDWEAPELRQLVLFETIIVPDRQARDRIIQVFCKPPRLPRIVQRQTH